VQIKVCVIENEKHFMNQLIEVLKKWEFDSSCQLVLSLFDSGGQFWNEKHIDYDIIFLDIQLGDSNGVAIAQKLRQRQYKKEIVFLTAFKEYVFEGYNVQAMHYLLKPIAYEPVKRCMDIILKNASDTDYIYRYKGNISRIPFNEIIYFTSCNHQIEIATVKESLRQAETFRKILTGLPEQFHQCHRTTTVNLNHVSKIFGHNIYLSNGCILPISQTYLFEIQNAFLNYIPK